MANLELTLNAGGAIAQAAALEKALRGVNLEVGKSQKKLDGLGLSTGKTGRAYKLMLRTMHRGFMNVTKALVGVQSSLDALASRGGRGMAGISTGANTARREVTRLNRSLEQTSTRSRTATQSSAMLRGAMMGAGQSMMFLSGKALIAGASVFALVSGFRKAINAGRDFEESFAHIKAVVVASGEESEGAIEALKHTILELARDTKFTAAETSKGMEQLIRAGIGAGDAIAAMKPVLNLATIGQTDAATSADNLLSIMKQFNIPFSQAAQVADQMAVAVTKTRVTIKSLGSALRNVGALAGQANLPFSDTVALVSLFQEAGIAAGKSGTDLRRILLNLFDQTDKRQEVLKTLGVNLDDTGDSMTNLMDVIGQLQNSRAGIKQLLEIAGVRATPALITAVSTLPSKMQELRTAIAGASGTAEQMAAIIENTLNNAIKRFTSQLTVMSAKLFELQGMTLSNMFDSWSASIEEFTDNIPMMAERFSIHVRRMGRVVEDIGQDISDSLQVVRGDMTADWVIYFGETVVRKVIEGWQKIFKVLSFFPEALQYTRASIRELAMDFGNWLDQMKNKVSNISDTVGNVMDRLGETTKHGFQLVWINFQSWVDSAVATFFRAASVVTGWLAKLSSKVNGDNSRVTKHLNDMTKQYAKRGKVEADSLDKQIEAERVRHDKVMFNLEVEKGASVALYNERKDRLTELGKMAKEEADKAKAGILDTMQSVQRELDSIRKPKAPTIPDPKKHEPNLTIPTGRGGGSLADPKQVQKLAKEFEKLLTPMEAFQHRMAEIKKMVQSPAFAEAAKKTGLSIAQMEQRLKDSAQKQLQESLKRNEKLFKKSEEEMRKHLEKTQPLWAGMQNAVKKYQEEAGVTAKNVEGVFTKAFKGMEDALVQFVTTGKLDFKSLADSIISDLVRIMIQQSVMKPLTSMLGGGSSGGGGGGGIMDSLFGGVGDFIGGLFNAKGNVYGPQGVHAFAQGGIVNSPQIFPFANGIGLMGEAGPEGILPLARTSNGDLGVQTTGGSGEEVQVNITINAVDAPSVSRLLVGQKNVIAGIVQKAFNTRGKRGPLDA